MKTDRCLVREALERSLRHLPADDPTFRYPDGTTVTAGQMLELLASDDPADNSVVDDFLRDVVGAAVRVVQLRVRP